MARTKCSCGGPIVSGEGFEVCVRCGDTRQISVVFPATWHPTTPRESAAREPVSVGQELTREPYEEAP